MYSCFGTDQLRRTTARRSRPGLRTKDMAALRLAMEPIRSRASEYHPAGAADRRAGYHGIRVDPAVPRPLRGA